MKYTNSTANFDDAQTGNTKKHLSEHLFSLIKIDTRSELSNETEAVKYIASICRDHGIEYSIVEPCPGKASLIARIHGNNSHNDGILLLSHIDTAGWSQEKWQYHPLSGELIDGRIYGRGAIDCKSLVVIWLNIMIELSKARNRPAKDIFFIASADEESGGSLGMKWIAENTDVISKCKFAINEGGGYVIPAPKGNYLTCQYGEKGFIKYSHMGTIPDGQYIIRGTGLFRGFKNLINRVRYDYWQHVLKDAPVKPDFINSYFNTLSKDSDNSIILSVNDKVDTKLIKNALDIYGININQVKEISRREPTLSASTSGLYKLIKKTAREFGYKGIIPVITKGSSDSRFLRERGLTTYGFFPVGLRESIFSMHSANEFIHIDTLYEGFDLLYRVVAEYIYPL